MKFLNDIVEFRQDESILTKERVIKGYANYSFTYNIAHIDSNDQLGDQAIKANIYEGLTREISETKEVRKYILSIYRDRLTLIMKLINEFQDFIDKPETFIRNRDVSYFCFKLCTLLDIARMEDDDVFNKTYERVKESLDNLYE